MVPASSHKVSRVSWYSGSRRCGSVFAYGAFTLSGWPSQGHSADSATNLCGPKPRGARAPVWALPISLAATLRIDFSFLSSGYLDVSVHRVPSHTLWIHVWVTEVCSAGFPHSEICGSMDICSSPQLIAAYRVFHRLLVPRHPPCALISLTICFLLSDTRRCIALHLLAAFQAAVFNTQDTPACLFTASVFLKVVSCSSRLSPQRLGCLEYLYS